MTPEIAPLDANVLYPAPLRDLLLQLASAGLYQVRWSADIDDEWKRNLLAARPELAAQIARTQAVMHRAIPDALVTDYTHLIADLLLPDPDDRHVLAAALAPHDIEALHPDLFLKSIADTEPTHVLTRVRACLSRLVRPPMSAAAYLANFRAIGLTNTGPHGAAAPPTVARPASSRPLSAPRTSHRKPILSPPPPIR